jgi:L-malate glycosyltransferase
MNVLHIDEQRGWRGGEQQASWLISGLAARGHVSILAGRPGAPFLTSFHGAAGLPHVAAPFHGEWDLWTAYRLARAVKRYDVDILHAHTSHAHAVACLARALAGRGKVVVTRRVSFPIRPRRLNRWKYALPDRIVAVSGRVAQVLVEAGLDPARIATVHSAVDPQRLDVSPLPRSDLSLGENAPVLLNAGALVGHKDHHTLLAAMALIIERAPEARLVIAGEGPLRPMLEARIRELGLDHAVYLLGHRTDVPRLTRMADVYVSSSNSEGLGTSVLEALVCGTPVAATAAGGVPEMVVDGETGLLAAIADPASLAEAVLRLLDDPIQAKEMARRGRKRALELFSVEQMVEGNLAVYRQLLEEGPP